MGRKQKRCLASFAALAAALLTLSLPAPTEATPVEPARCAGQCLSSCPTGNDVCDFCGGLKNCLVGGGWCAPWQTWFRCLL